MRGSDIIAVRPFKRLDSMNMEGKLGEEGSASSGNSVPLVCLVLSFTKPFQTIQSYDDLAFSQAPFTHVRLVLRHDFQ